MENEPLPGFTRPSMKERIDALSQLPYGARKGIKPQKSMNIGLWDEDERNQLDWIRDTR